jgi:sugar O-acyltransferase (sialic acid O-acetyltransferase NeuD family)
VPRAIKWRAVKGIVIFGTGPFADLAHYYFTTDSPHEVVGFTVDAAYLHEPRFKGLPVVAWEEVEREFPPPEHGMFVAIGIRQVNGARATKVGEAEAKGYELVSLLSSRADVDRGLVLKPNTMVMEKAGIQPFVEIGRGTIIWPMSRIGFRTRIGEHCWIVSSVFGESVTVGDRTFVGLNATVAPGVTLGRSNVIGAGALITRDTKDHEVYRGVASRPARAPSHRLRGF